MKSIFTRINLIIVTLLFCSLSVFSQEIEITGKVTDEQGTPIAGANLTIVGKKTGALTDFDGNYSIKASIGQELKCSYLGMKSSTKKIENQNPVNFKLADDLLNLDEVIVTGTSGIATKKQLGSAISTISSKDLSQSKAVVSIGDALQGQIAGAQINRNSGSPSGGVSISLRGASTLTGNSNPLYIIDGVIINNSSSTLINLGGYTQNRLVDINPDDIDRIEVLKGAAAAAIYGSRASNGVIQIFTKKGKIGEPRITYATSFNVNNLRKKMPYNDAQLKWDGDTAVPATRYDYQDYIFNTAYGYENSLNINGGTEKTKYSFSASQYKNGGIVRNTDFDRKTFRIRLDQKLYDWFSMSAGSFISFNKSNDMPNGKNYGPITSLLFADNINNIAPDEFGNYPNIGWMANPREAIDRIDATTKNYRSISDIQLKLTPFEGFNFNYTFGYDHSNSEGLIYIPNGFNTRPDGLSQKVTINSDMINSDINMSYQFQLSDNLKSTTGAGYSYQYEEIQRFGVTNNSVLAIDGVIVTDPASASAGIDYRTQASYWGGYLQQNFNYKDKLFLTLAGRLDGASTFGLDERQQFYSKVSTSYAISDEDFWKNSFGNIFDSFKLRGAWGQAGNLTALRPYLIYTNYNSSTYNGNIGLIPSTIQGNPNLAPERQTETEFGFDTSMLNNRLSIEFSYYSQKIDHLLINRPLSPSTGFDQQYANVANMTNKGFELLIKGTPIRNENLSWSITSTLSHNKNKATNVEGYRQGLGMFGTSVAQEGEALGVFYGTYFATDANGDKLLTDVGKVQKALGHYEGNTPVQDYDVNGQPTGTVLRKIIGDPNPNYTASITNEFEYKNFGFRFQWDISKGNDVMSWDKRMGYLFKGGKSTADELNGIIPKGSSVANFGIFQSFIEDGSYIKLREIALTYNLKLNKSYLKNVKFTLSGNNLISIDNYWGSDPEVNTEGQTNGVKGQEMANVPIPAVYKLGVIFNF
ncbi:SusC/RagA family TonB-linked outer membrane protein [Lutibacter sp.]|uniref:SusC/RagA family TonB-linked outer membrane protein n=1 Tax=Lutibacter sp. TaxID=1925666 RepID=UPI0025C277B3|nr:SusC/RagA family TonB-linked outer membrane protein [Lutibacter sp.]MCF6181196.1 SusC/RagA family TonB-linked outer membrane protein [Lutibacter sp.]